MLIAIAQRSLWIPSGVFAREAESMLLRPLFLSNSPLGVCRLAMVFFSYLVKLCLSLTSWQASSDLWNVLLPTGVLSWAEAGPDTVASYGPHKGSQGTQLRCVFACRFLGQPSFGQVAADLTENCLLAWMSVFPYSCRPVRLFCSSLGLEDSTGACYTWYSVSNKEASQLQCS